VKVGPWGVQDGNPWDINSQSKPQRLESITIYSSEYARGCIYGFSFVYVDQQGKHKVDTRGTAYGTGKDIKMRPGEHLNSVSGTFDDQGITSLKLETNQTKYNAYGDPTTGEAFSLPLQEGKGEVVAFFGRSGDTLKALGVYVPGMNGSPVKVGQWGGSGGAPRDISQGTKPAKLESFTVHSTQFVGGRIYGFAFTYVDENGQSFTVSTIGKTDGNPQKVR